MRRVPTGRFVDTVSADMKQLLTQHKQGVDAVSDIADVVTSTAYTLNGIVFPERQVMNGLGDFSDDVLSAAVATGNFLIDAAGSVYNATTGALLGTASSIYDDATGAVSTVYKDTTGAVKAVYNDATGAISSAASAVPNTLSSLGTFAMWAGVAVALVVFYPEIRGAMSGLHHEP